MEKRRDTYNYSLWQGGKKVYIGTSKYPDRRADQHEAAGKRFDRVEIARQPRTPASAKAEEARQLDVYRRGHGGRNPRYNKDCDG